MQNAECRILMALLLIPIGLLVLMGKANAANEITANVRIERPSATVVHQNVPVPDSCTVTDSAGGRHTFTRYETICALQVLQEQGLITYGVTNFGEFGLFLDQINGLYATGDFSQFWIFRFNNDSADVGISAQRLTAGDKVLFTYGPWASEPLQIISTGNQTQTGSILNLAAQVWNDNTNLFEDFTSAVAFYINGAAFNSTNGRYDWKVDNSSQIKIHVEAAGRTRSEKLNLAGPPTTASHFAAKIVRDTFNVDRGVQFIVGEQTDNGAVGRSNMVNDWSAIALSAQNYNQAARDKIKSYLMTNPPAGDAVTDSLRRAMALMALGINPYDVAGVNYIQPIIDGFAGGYLGKKEFINEEVFALLVLRQAGFGRGEKIITTLMDQVMAAQQDNGSWADSTDMSAAAIQAMLTVRNLADVETAIERAEAYLRTQQTDYGGFNDSEFSTAWAIQAIAALGKSEADWYKNSLTPGEFLGAKQDKKDGGMSPLLPLDMRLWSTATVIPAALNKSWLELLTEFPKGEIREPITALTVPEANQTPVSENKKEKMAEPLTSTAPTVEEKTPDVGEELNANAVNDVPPSNNQTFSPTTQTAPLITESETTTAYENASEITLTAATLPLSKSPVQKTARNIFQTTATLATPLGAYLAWRLLQTVV